MDKIGQLKRFESGKVWSLIFKKRGESVRLDIDPDDVVFYAVMKRGPTVHLQGKTSVRCMHIAENERGVLELNMSLLDATHVEHLNEEFLTIGVMGLWKLLKPKDSTVPTFKLEKLITNADEFLNEAQSRTNPFWVRDSYMFNGKQ
jgi:hypothetical protein